MLNKRWRSDVADLKNMKGVSDRDRKMIEEAETLLGPEPDKMGFVKNLFWGNFREDLIFPYPRITPSDELAECDQLMARLEEYLKNEHPSTQIDQEQEIPDWVIARLFELGALGMTIPKEYGGLGMGITSYNRVLELIGKYCGSTAVVLSAHLSIGCGAIKLFGTDEQKQRWLPNLAKEWLSAFCLSEPNVGCDAGGQETTCHLSEDGEHYILNGEKKWATSGALAGLFTVMAKQKMPDGKERVTALVCTPDMAGIDIFQKNRSKCGIRGTWQARIKFTDVKVPKANLLHKEGKGLNVALTCLNYGRCTLSAGMLGGAVRAKDQAIRWSQTRYQFDRALGDFELVKERIARMSAYAYAMDSVLYATTGFLDRKDSDIMVETAICKVFCSEMGWRVVNDAMQIMGGEGYMTENEVERIFRDSRINLIVEGANEVMQSFVFAYGAKQLAEQMLSVQEKPIINKVDGSLRSVAERLTRLTQEHSHQFKRASKNYEEKIVERQAVQARVADTAVMLHAWACTLSRLDEQIRAGENGADFAADKAAAMHFFDLAELEIHNNFRALNGEHADDTLFPAAEAAVKQNMTRPASDFVIPEKSPTDQQGNGRTPRQDGIRQFPGDRHAAETVNS